MDAKRNPPRLVVVPDANPAGARALEYALVDHDYDYDYDYDINIKINIIKKKIEKKFAPLGPFEFL